MRPLTLGRTIESGHNLVPGLEAHTFVPIRPRMATTATTADTTAKHGGGGVGARAAALLRMPATELSELLDELDRQGGVADPAKVASLGATDLFAYRNAGATLAVYHPGGGVGRYPVQTRCLSTREVRLLHSGYIHTGVRATLSLTTLAGDTLDAHAKVERCAHLRGMAHEVCMQFEKPIDPRQLLKAVSIAVPDAEPEFNPLDLAGRVLLLDDEEAAIRLMQHHLASTRVALTACRQVGAALDAVRRQPFDAGLVDLNLEEQRGEDAIRMLGEAGFRGPLILLAGEASPTRIRAAKDAGVCDVLPKPYQCAELFTLLRRWLGAAEGDASDEPVTSRLAGDPSMAALLAWYVPRVRSLAHEMQKSRECDSFDGLRARVLTLKETATGYGYDALHLAAVEALTALDASMSVAESAPTLNRLESVCRRVR